MAIRRSGGFHHRLPPLINSPWTQEQDPTNDRSVGTREKSNRRTPILGFLTGSCRFKAFSGQIGLGHIYKTCSIHLDLHFCKIWEFLEIVDFSGESGQLTAVCGGGWAEASPDLPRLNLILQFHSSSNVRHLNIIEINDPTVRSSLNFNML